MRWILAAYISLLIAASPATAQGWTPRTSDTVLDRETMLDRVIGATHEFYDGGQSFFSISGSYSYTYTSGQVAYGTWTWPDDDSPGVICTAFREGFFPRCDLYVATDRGLVLLTENGLRLPIRRNSADE